MLYKSQRIQGNNANGINASPRTASYPTFYFVLIYLLCIFAQHKIFLVYVAPVFLCFESYASNIFLILFMEFGVFRLCSCVAIEFYAVLTMLKQLLKTNICMKTHCPVSFPISTCVFHIRCYQTSMNSITPLYIHLLKTSWF